MNKIVLLGRLVKDPTSVNLENKDLKITKITLAVDRRTSKTDKQSDFIQVTFFGKTAETAEKYLRKGSLISVTGKLQTGSYEDKDGNKKYTLDVIGSELEMIQSKRTEEAV